MYYILSETNKLIAADDKLLELCGVSHIDDLSLKIALGETLFDKKTENELIISNENNQMHFSYTNSRLSSLLGEITLVNIYSEETEKKIESQSPLSLDALEEESDLDDTVFSLLDESEEEQEEILSIDTSKTDDILTDNTEEDILLSEDTLDLDTIFDNTASENEADTEPVESEKERSDDTLSISLADEDLLEPKERSESEEVPKKELVAEDEDLSSLLLDSEPEFTIDTTEEKEEAAEIENIEVTLLKEDTSPIVIDIETISQEIGISKEDYNGFLDEFIDTALGLEKDLQNIDKKRQSNAIKTLSHLGQVLHLPVIGEKILAIESALPENQKDTIESFYTTLSRLTTASIQKEEKLELNESSPDDTIFEIKEDEESNSEAVELLKIDETEEESAEDTLELLDEVSYTDTEEESAKEILPEVKSEEKGFGIISLDNVKPIHFDFQLEEAANDLSLPVELIEEFVHDFIAQAHIETKKMLTAYEAGNLDTIQKIGHLLKGASSNLRINPLAETLYKIQFCEEPSELEALIKDYWAHFLSFETQINMISK